MIILGGRVPNGPNSDVLTASTVPEVLATALVQVSNQSAPLHWYQPNMELGFLHLSYLSSVKGTLHQCHIFGVNFSSSWIWPRTPRGRVYWCSQSAQLNHLHDFIRMVDCSILHRQCCRRCVDRGLFVFLLEAHDTRWTVENVRSSPFQWKTVWVLFPTLLSLLID